jgi:hypothetical protein
MARTWPDMGRRSPCAKTRFMWSFHDFSAMVKEPGPMLEPLRDQAYFARVFLEFGAPTWPNGFNIAPEWLRREMEAAGELAPIAAE